MCIRDRAMAALSPQMELHENSPLLLMQNYDPSMLCGLVSMTTDLSLIHICPCQSLSLSGEVARRSRDGEGCFRDEPSQSRCARQLSRGGEPLAKRAGFVLTSQGQKKSADKR